MKGGNTSQGRHFGLMEVKKKNLSGAVDLSCAEHLLPPALTTSCKCSLTFDQGFTTIFVE